MVQTNSRFITYPSVVEKSDSHTVVLVDATNQDIENIGLFCKVANLNYDIYLYKHNGDLEWLSHVTSLTDQIIINPSSEVKVGSPDVRYLDDMVTYFQEIDQI